MSKSAGATITKTLKTIRENDSKLMIEYNTHGQLHMHKLTY